MGKILVEVFATTSCNGAHGAMPDFIKNLSGELSVDVEFVPYLMWDMDSPDGFPAYMAARLAEIRNGEASAGGLFINGEWFEQRPHNADDVVKIRQKFLEVVESTDPKNIDLLGRSIEIIKIEGSSLNGRLHFANSVVKEMGSFSTDFDAVWFFEGSIKDLNIDRCPVEKFRYKGYDINKLIEIAEKHPELFANKESGEDKKEAGGSAKVEVQKANIDDIDIMLVPYKELCEKFHPCVIVEYKKDGECKMHKAISEKFGGVGYKAIRRTDSWTCGWMGIAPKDIFHRDRGYVFPCEIPDESVLCLLCYMGGGNYDPQFERIGIAAKMIKQAISDAKAKGYRRVEAYSNPEIIPVLEKCGFSCKEIQKKNGETQKYYYFDIA
jgi:GNAT superfamily N-acetyltransferase